jgi:hypothetical protein
MEKDEKISYFVHEGEMARMERHVKRLFIMWIVTFAALVLTNIGWIVYENQFQDVVTETYTAETDQGGTAIANGSGEVHVNDESNLHENNKATEENP